MRRSYCLATLIIAAFFSSNSAAQSIKPQSALSPDAYIARRGGTLVPAGRLVIDDHPMTCGESPTVLDPNERDFGSAPPGFLILNPALFAGLATSVKLWIFSHECAHQTVGSDEVKADCFAVQRGRREGWLTPAGLDQVCEFMRPAREDYQHFNGVHRCELMRQCFQDTKGPPSR
jgi:hypothetical protein